MIIFSITLLPFTLSMCWGTAALLSVGLSFIETLLLGSGGYDVAVLVLESCGLDNNWRRFRVLRPPFSGRRNAAQFLNRRSLAEALEEEGS